MIGPVPPPAGGVSIHLIRLTQLLRNYFETDFVDESRVIKHGVFNLRQKRLATYFHKITRNNIVHIHSGTRSLKYFHIICAKVLLRKKTVLTIHSYIATSGFLKFLDRIVYGLPDITIVVRGGIQDTLKLKNRVEVKEAFLPPLLEDEPALPSEIINWIKDKRSEGAQVVSANAWRLKTHNGEDLYGLDLCIEAALKLRNMGRKVCFVYAVSDLNGDLDINEYDKRIKENNLTDIFYLQKSQLSFVQLIQMSDIVLRPTNTDGDALTVREGLYFQRHVIASDVVTRPVGTKIFANRSADSLTQEIDKALAQPINGNANGVANGQEFASFYKEIYDSLS